MPVIRNIPQDPTDLVIQGEQCRLPEEQPFRWESYWSPLINDPPDRIPSVPSSLVNQLYLFGMIDLGTRQFSPRVPDQALGRGIRANSCVCTPCGAVIPVLLGPQWFWNDIGQSTVRFAVSGVTKDSTGATLGDCRVVAFETGRIATGAAPVVGETYSDGSGNYTLNVPLNTSFQLIAYKPGSPDVAGITVNTVVPISA